MNWENGEYLQEEKYVEVNRENVCCLCNNITAKEMCNKS